MDSICARCGGSMTPNLDHLVAAATGDFIGDKVDAVHLVGMARQIFSDLERFDRIPQLER